MEKLIELLLECKPQIHYLDKPKGVYDNKYGIGWYKREGDIGGWFSEEVIISKKFGFIKRLVENEKIDLKKLDETERKPMYVTDDMFSLYKVDECVIMLCSIQDNPIEYLCSILNE